MPMNQAISNVNRRGFLQKTAALTAAGGLAPGSFGQVCSARDGTVRDRIWIFANPANGDYNFVRKRSVMTPLEACVYMGAPNLLMVNQYPGEDQVARFGEEGKYKAFEPPYAQYAYSLKVLKRVVWSIVGAGGITRDEERRQVLELARTTPNIVGLFMDDFFTDRKSGKLASLTLDQVRDVQRQLKQSSKKLDLYVTLYTRQLDPAIQEYLSMIDVVTLWTWETAEMENLEANLAKLERLAPKSRKLLGCYTSDYDPKRTPWWTALPVPIMKKQCETGLKWLKQGRIDGIIIYGTAMDLGWDSVDWAREWVQKAGDQKL
ncbi:MAG: twin-arginine translocation signal domain-containing protein [Acidobacteriales bacterium]|nr:twin-arginine translocation signal domain-containing protein [Terriglobales bacterium]